MWTVSVQCSSDAVSVLPLIGLMCVEEMMINLIAVVSDDDKTM